MNLFQQLAELATNLVARLGYGGLAFGLIVDSAGVPIPSEVLIPLAGALARDGRFDLVTVITVGTLAQTLGAVLAYWIGAKGGLPIVERYGKYVLFSHRELAVTQRWFDRYGSWLTFFGRCLPVIRTYIGFPAGLARMPFGPFLAASFTGSLAWITLLALLGYQLSGQLERIDAVMHQFSILIALLLLGGVIWYIKKHWKRQL
ncbi:DedA family protein [Candidatus Parcubacteria bacterium]|nr:DedA family protein [Candidatus Parcubacteria bacterium]